MSFKGQWTQKFLRLFESTTNESIPVAPVMFYDDFRKLDTTNIWTLKDTNGGTETHFGDSSNGTVALAMSAGDEKQEAGIYFGDDRVFALDHGPNFEAYVNPGVLCTGTGEMMIGLAGDYVEGTIVTDGPAEHILFVMDGNGAIVIYTDDGTTDNDGVATGVTLTAASWAVLRIDCTDPTNIMFYINGTRVASGTTFSANAVPTLALQPYIVLHKESGTGVGTLSIDYVRVWSDRA